jgi:hypothetical protein
MFEYSRLVTSLSDGAKVHFRGNQRYLSNRKSGYESDSVAFWPSCYVKFFIQLQTVGFRYRPCVHAGARSARGPIQISLGASRLMPLSLRLFSASASKY